MKIRYELVLLTALTLLLVSAIAAQEGVTASWDPGNCWDCSRPEDAFGAMWLGHFCGCFVGLMRWWARSKDPFPDRVIRLNLN